MAIDTQKLIEEFSSISNEMSVLLENSDSLAKSGIGKESWERYKELEELRRQKAKDLFIGNCHDEKYDYVHDAILCEGDGICTMPNGYSAIVIASYYNSIMAYYCTIAVVKTPNNEEYFIDVPTYGYMKPGTKISN